MDIDTAGGRHLPHWHMLQITKLIQYDGHKKKMNSHLCLLWNWLGMNVFMNVSLCPLFLTIKSYKYTLDGRSFRGRAVKRSHNGEKSCKHRYQVWCRFQILFSSGMTILAVLPFSSLLPWWRLQWGPISTARMLTCLQSLQSVWAKFPSFSSQDLFSHTVLNEPLSLSQYHHCH